MHKIGVRLVLVQRKMRCGEWWKKRVHRTLVSAWTSSRVKYCGFFEWHGWLFDRNLWHVYMRDNSVMHISIFHLVYTVYGMAVAGPCCCCFPSHQTVKYCLNCWYGAASHIKIYFYRTHTATNKNEVKLPLLIAYISESVVCVCVFEFVISKYGTDDSDGCRQMFVCVCVSQVAQTMPESFDVTAEMMHLWFEYIVNVIWLGNVSQPYNMRSLQHTSEAQSPIHFKSNGPKQQLCHATLHTSHI